MIRLLFYNWVPLDNSTEGGGVAKYQKDLLQYLSKRISEYDIYYLSSGFTYDVTGKLKVREYSYLDNIKCLDIVNSPIVSPGSMCLKNLSAYIYDKKLGSFIMRLISKYGNFDIVHLNNIEGLSLSAINAFKTGNTRLILSAHNYFPICPQVNLWESESQNCNSKNCAECAKSSVFVYPALIKITRVIEIRGSYFITRNIRKTKYTIKRILERFDSNAIRGHENYLYHNYIKQNVDLLNNTVDLILAVSQRVKDVYSNNGINQNKILVQYIGTNAAESFVGRCIAQSSDILNVIYMGYMRKDKGGFFMLDALEKLPKELTKSLSFTFVAKGISDYPESLNRLNSIESRFFKLIIKDGYSKDEQISLLLDKNLGIVPVLWEDNLPQVAIEQVSAGVPILTSDLGGASELFSRDENFIFEAGNVEDFAKKLDNIFKNRDLLNYFWNKTPRPKTMEEHVEELKSIYIN